MGRDTFVAPTASKRPPTPDILGAALAKDTDAGESIEIKSTLAWNYEQLGSNAASAIEHTVAIKKSERRASEAIIEAGQHLIAMKGMLNHGQWGDWLAAEFGMSHQTAFRMMQVAEHFGSKSNNLLNLKPSVLYMLAADNVPEPAREAVLNTAAAGVQVTVADAKEVISQYKPAPAVLNTPAAEAQPAGETVQQRIEREWRESNAARVAMLEENGRRNEEKWAQENAAILAAKATKEASVITLDDLPVVDSVTVPVQAQAAVGADPDEEIVHPLDCYDDAQATPYIGKMNKCHELKMWLKATRDEKTREYRKLTGQEIPALFTGSIDHMIAVLEETMDAVEQEAVANANQ